MSFNILPAAQPLHFSGYKPREYQQPKELPAVQYPQHTFDQYKQMAQGHLSGIDRYRQQMNENSAAEAQSPMNQFLAATGQGIGNGIQQQLKQSILEKALEQHGGISPEQRNQILAVSRLDPEQQQLIAGAQAQQAKQQQAQAYNQVLNQIPGVERGQANAQGMPNFQAIEDPVRRESAIRLWQKQQELGQKKSEGRIASEEKISLPILVKNEEEREGIQRQEGALRLARNAVENGDLEGFNKDFLADITGAEAFRSAEGALLKTAMKENLLGNLNRVSGRPNMYIEQQISSMGPQIGRSRTANLGVIEVLEGDAKVARRRSEVIDRLADQYRKDLGYVPANIGRVADEEVRPYAQKIQDVTAYKIQKLREEENPNQLTNMHRVTKGTPLTLQKAQILLDAVGGDETKAMRLAKDMGHSITEEGVINEVEQ